MGYKRIGVILARMQPIHNGHLELVSRAYRENEAVYIFVGSADKFNKRNPIPISTRPELVRKSILDMLQVKWGVDKAGDGNYDSDSQVDAALINHGIHVVPLDDLDDESNNSHEWGFYLYSKIVTETGCPNFTMYYSDGYEIITTWFPGFILRNNVSLSLIARNSVENGISATEVRKLITERRDDELRSVVPAAVFDKREHLKTLIELSEKIV